MSSSALSYLLRTKATLSIGMILLLLALAPLAVAQDVHHELAAADHDGHEHSDTDLCQWVKHHATGSLSTAILPLSSWEIVTWRQWLPVTAPVSLPTFAVGPSRAPPRS